MSLKKSYTLVNFNMLGESNTKLKNIEKKMSKEKN